MNRLGLDFGTTNSILSYYDPRLKAVNAFALGGAGTSEFTPSLLSLEKKNRDNVAIGRSAEKNRGDPNFKIFKGFGMLLTDTNPAKLDRLGFDTQDNPKRITRRYLSLLLEAYCKEQDLDEPIETLIVTLPDIWIKEGRHAAREVLQDICRTLSPQPRTVRMLSESVAAAVYFAYNYRLLKGRKFEGHLLVCDFGGRTLDISLSEINAHQVTVLERTGTPVDPGSSGAAGEAFDEALLNRKLAEGHIEPGDVLYEREFYPALKELEEQMITRNTAIDQSMALFYDDPERCNTEVFTHDRPNNIGTTARDMAEVFEMVTRPVLTKSLEKIQGALSERSIDVDNSEKFRVVMVGGFSNFYPVRKTVRDFFGSRTESDRRFETCFSQSDTALAVSKGAALVANNLVNISNRCPINIGFQYRKMFGEEIVKVDQVVLSKGGEISEYQHPVYWRIKGEEQTFRMFRGKGDESLTVCVDGGENGKKYIELDQKLDDIAPNLDRRDNAWRIGFSVDDDLTFWLHIKDKDNQEQTTRIGKLMEIL
ncbi:MAG: Hsp70 family protein [Proteobacteria bacterium]|nr:Hsp70 family protein [Pseudomonadota bacterium]